MVEKSEATPVFRLVDRGSDRTVGIEYRWNTGETSILWRGGSVDKFIRLPIVCPNPNDD